MYTVIVLYMFHKYIILIYFVSRHFRKPPEKVFWRNPSKSGNRLCRKEILMSSFRPLRFTAFFALAAQQI